MEKSKRPFIAKEFFNRMSHLGELQAVLDPNDKLGYKNYYIGLIHKTALRQVISFDKIKLALDFGCGLGRIARWLAERVEHIEAVDIAEEMINRAKEMLKEYNNISVSLYDGNRLLYDDHIFDLVTVIGVLQHVIDISSVNNILSEVSRVTKQDGIVIFIERTSNDEPHEKGMPEDYIIRRPIRLYKELFYNNGLKVHLHYPIRTSLPICNSGFIQQLLYSGKVSVYFFPLIIKLDLFLQKRNMDAQWADVLFLCSKGPK